MFLVLVHGIVRLGEGESGHQDPFGDRWAMDAADCSDGDGRVDEDWMGKEMVDAGREKVDQG